MIVDDDGFFGTLNFSFRAACELLLEAEADVDGADVGGRTPLLAAASMGHAHVVELLLFWGCYVDSIDAEGRTVLSVAAAQVRRPVSLFFSFLSFFIVHSLKDSLSLSLSLSNVQGSVEVVRRLLERGLDEAHRDNAGWTPLHYAAFEGHAPAADLLLDAGGRVDALDNDGRSPLLLAAQVLRLSFFFLALLNTLAKKTAARGTRHDVEFHGRKWPFDWNNDADDVSI